MHLLTETIGVLLDALQLAVLLNSFFFVREERRRFVLPGYLLFCTGLWVLSLYPPLSAHRLLYTFAGVFILALFLYEIRFWQSIFVSTVFCVLYAVVDLLCMGMLVGIGLATDALMQPGIPRTVFVLLAHLVYLLLLVVIKAFSKKQAGTLRFQWLIPLLPGQIFSILYWKQICQGGFTLKTPEITILRQEPQQYATFSIASYILHAKIFTIFC